jgi:methionyl aminopeptidase
MRLLIMGPPGAGKGTQAAMICEEFGITHVSTGDLFRLNLTQGTALGQEAKKYMDAGEYVPDSVTNGMVRERLKDADTQEGFLLDGYPRTVAQVAELDGMLSKTPLDRVIELTADTDEVVKRLLGRAIEQGRVDDTEDVIRRRLEVYEEQTAPLTALYKSRGLTRMQLEAVPGVTTEQLDRIAREMLKAAGAESSFLGYFGYPSVICASVNEEVVHAIPNPRTLQDGDILSVDFGAIVEGWNGDAAVTIEIGKAIDKQTALSKATELSMWAGLSQAVAGNRLSDISHAVEKTIRNAGPYGILEEYGGHGIGTKMHMDPLVPNYGEPGHGPELVVGMALAIEPMATLGSRHVRTLEDDWTVVTTDGSHAAHWEHTVAITEEGPWVLTAHDGGAAYFQANGIPSPAAKYAV